MHSYVYLASTAIFSKIASYPFDTIKVRLQTVPVAEKNDETSYYGTLDCAKKIYSEEGIQGFYKGLGVYLIGWAPTVYVEMRSLVTALILFQSKHHILIQVFYFGAFTGLCTSVIIAPIERVKCLLQIQHGDAAPKYNGSIDCIKKLYTEGRINSLYKGLTATLLREIPAKGFYFVTMFSVAYLYDMWFNYNSFIWPRIAAGVAYWIVAIPFDVLKTRIQTTPDVRNKAGVGEVFENLVKTEGPVALYNGIIPALIQVLVLNTLFYNTFNFLSK